jgi:hypothetical protein
MSSDLTIERPLETARIVSSIPGRLRLRLAAGPAGRGALYTAVETLSANDSVSRASARWQTASLLIEYETSRADLVWSMLEQLGLDLDGTRRSRLQQNIEPSARVAHVVAGANEVVRRRAGGNDLRTLVPLGFGLLALRQFMRDDQRLADAPWYVLAWYAAGTFQKFHPSREGNQDG